MGGSCELSSFSLSSLTIEIPRSIKDMFDRDIIKSTTVYLLFATRLLDGYRGSFRALVGSSKNERRLFTSFLTASNVVYRGLRSDFVVVVVLCPTMLNFCLISPCLVMFDDVSLLKG